MFKWLFIIILAFLGTWLFADEYIPASVRYSGFGKVFESAVFPVRYEFGERHEGRHYKKIVSVDSNRLKVVTESVVGTKVSAVMFFYDVDCMMCRYVLRDINNLAKQYYGKKNIVFFVVAFEDDAPKLDFLLDSFKNVYFRPLITKEANIRQVAQSLSKQNIKAGEVPVLAFKSEVDNSYENMTTDFGAKARIKFLIDKNL